MTAVPMHCRGSSQPPHPSTVRSPSAHQNYPHGTRTASDAPPQGIRGLHTNKQYRVRARHEGCTLPYSCPSRLRVSSRVAAFFAPSGAPFAPDPTPDPTQRRAKRQFWAPRWSVYCKLWAALVEVGPKPMAVRLGRRARGSDRARHEGARGSEQTLSQG